MLLILLVSRMRVTEEPTKSPFLNTVLCNPVVEHLFISMNQYLNNPASSLYAFAKLQFNLEFDT